MKKLIDEKKLELKTLEDKKDLLFNDDRKKEEQDKVPKEPHEDNEFENAIDGRNYLY